MNTVYYDRLILQRIEKRIDSILPIAAILSTMSALAIYFSSIPFFFVIIDVAIGILLMVVFFLRKFITTHWKILIIILTAIIIGTLSFMHGAFASAGLTIFMLANVLSVLLLTKQGSFAISLSTVLLFLTLWWMADIGVIESRLPTGEAEWFVHFFMYVLYLIFLHTAVYSVRDHLIESIIDLEKSIVITEKLAFYDQLTGLGNQMLFKRKVSERLTGGYSGSLLLINIRNLRVINSIYGSSVGDRAIKKCALVLSEMTHESTIIGRVSGNEFALWLEWPHKHHQENADQLMEGFCNNFSLPGIQKHMDFSGSHVWCEPESKSFDQYYKEAALALTYAKKHDIMSVVAYDWTMEEAAVREEHMISLLETALEQRSFHVHYQPKLDTKVHKVIGVEALARWYTDSLGHVAPNEFIPLIERMNRFQSFGELIIHQVLQDYNVLESIYGPGVKVAINVSPSHLASEGFDRFIIAALQHHSVSPPSIILEVTEEIFIQGLSHVSSILTSLRSIGIGISLDDFGTGYSSLNYLMNLEIDEVKIDRSFVNQLLNNKKAEVMLEMIIRMTKEWDLNLVAEGVETEGQMKKLIEMGCHTLQGYYYAKPAPLALLTRRQT